MDDELFEYLLKRPIKQSSTPQVTQLFFDIDCCVRFLKTPYSEFLLLPRIIKQAYRYYFMMRSYHEELQENQRKMEEARTRSMSMMDRGVTHKQVRK